jgi:uncharacterized protein (DUF2164 family)
MAKNYMTQIKRKGDYITEIQRDQVIKQIINYFASERNEEIGIIAAGDILDFILATFSDLIRNNTLDEVIKITQQNSTSQLMDINSLKG